MKRIPKPHTKKTAKKRAWDMFSIWVRLRECWVSLRRLDMGRCFTCGRIYRLEELQAGHFIAGRSNSVLFCEKGVRGQDYRCNIEKGGEPLVFRRRLVDIHGEETVQMLEIKKNMPVQYRLVEYDALYYHYKREVERVRDDYAKGNFKQISQRWGC